MADTELLTAAGLNDGDFLVRPRVGTSDAVLSATFKGKVGHHLITLGPDGIYLINKKQFGEPHTIEEVSLCVYESLYVIMKVCVCMRSRVCVLACMYVHAFMHMFACM